MPKIIKAAFALVLLIACLTTLPQSVTAAYDSGYVISDYNTDITIGTDNIYRITETLTVNFNEYRHGIYRYIPYIQEMRWEENERPILYRTPIKNLSVTGSIYSAVYEGNNYVIKIGNPNIIVIGENVYIISYSHGLGNDKLDTRDLVYYNIVGTDWDTVIENVSFSIHMPKDFDPSQLWFYSGKSGQTGDAPVDYVIEGNTISGALAGKLAPGEGLTIQIDLPQGYFEPPEEFDWNGFLINLALGLDAAALLLFLMFGLNKASARFDEYNPPDTISPAEAGYIIENTINDGDVISLILYWATKGYLSIEQLDEEDFRITRLKNLPSEHKDYEVYMFNELFPSSDPVTLSQLQTKFFVVISDTKDLIKEYYSKKETRFYNPISIILGKIFSFVPAILIFSSLLLGIYENTFALFVAAVITVMCTVVIILPLALLTKTIKRWNRLHIAKSRLRLIISVLLSAVLLGGYTFAMSYFRLQTLGFVISGSALFISIISAFMRKRTKLGNELMSRMLGLKGFMEKSDKSTLEGIVAQSPYYFYDVMPYAFVFGMTNIWARKFHGIHIMQPNWYVRGYLSSFLFSPFAMQMALHRAFSYLRAPVAKKPNVSAGTSNIPRGGGSAGGGGSSGGGFGGGGGKSW